jgi:hypothetical protein
VYALFRAQWATSTMQQQITRDNHYVPQWYHRGFLVKGKHKLHVLNLRPATKSLRNGQTLVEPEELYKSITYGVFLERPLLADTAWCVQFCIQPRDDLYVLR